MSMNRKVEFILYNSKNFTDRVELPLNPTEINLFSHKSAYSSIISKRFETTTKFYIGLLYDFCSRKVKLPNQTFGSHVFDRKSEYPL